MYYGGNVLSTPNQKEWEEKVKTVQENVKKKLMSSTLLDGIIDEVFMDGNYPWATECQGYYDNCCRSVFIIEDGFVVKWHSIEQEQYVVKHDGSGNPVYGKRDVEKVHGETAYSFTKSGYMPLHEYKEIVGEGKTQKEITVEVKDILRICAEVVREKLHEKKIRFYYDAVVSEKDIASFVYHVPRGAWKDWF